MRLVYTSTVSQHPTLMIGNFARWQLVARRVATTRHRVDTGNDVETFDRHPMGTNEPASTRSGSAVDHRARRVTS